MSRYSFRAFWHFSSSLFWALSTCSRPSVLQHAITPGRAWASSMSSLNSVSTPSKRFVSSGSWARMSADARKMASSELHDFCTPRSSLRTVSTLPRVCCHVLTRERKKSTNRPMPTIDCSCIWWSSSVFNSSSDAT